MSRKRILIVDDNEVFVTTLSMKLRANNYDIITAGNGSAAVSAVHEQRPDLIVLDLGFQPEVTYGGAPWDGFQVIQCLRLMEEAKNTPIITITSGSAEKFKHRAMIEGAIAFFQKPIDSSELLATINKSLEGEDTAQASAHAA